VTISRRVTRVISAQQSICYVMRCCQSVQVSVCCWPKARAEWLASWRGIRFTICTGVLEAAMLLIFTLRQTHAGSVSLLNFLPRPVALQRRTAESFFVGAPMIVPKRGGSILALLS
jgi:hypothetical protein